MLHFINKAGQNVCGIFDTVRKVSAKLYSVQYVGNQAYLPGTGDTLILKEVPPGRGLSIALRAG